MPQLSAGFNYEPTGANSLVTAGNLNQHVNNAQLQGGAIGEQNNITTLTGDEYSLLYNSSTGLLSKTQVKNLLLTGNDVITDSVVSTTNTLTINSSSLNQAGCVMNINSPAGYININSRDIALSADNGSTAGQITFYARDRIQFSAVNDIWFGTSVTFNDTVDFEGGIQINGQAGYFLSSIYEETIPHYGSIAAGLTNALHTTSAFTKPVGEIWEMEISLRYYGAAGYVYEFAGRYGSETPQTGSYLFYERRHDGAGGGAVGNELYTCRWVVPSAETFTAQTIKIDTNAGSGSGLQLGMQTGLAGSVCSGAVYPSKFRIYKYKSQ